MMMKKTALLTAILMTLSACVVPNQSTSTQKNTTHFQNKVMSKDMLSRQLCAIEHKEINTIQHLIKQGADINFSCPYGSGAYRTKLHSAVSNESIELVKLLIENGANVNARDKEGRTPLMVLAFHHDNIEIVRALLDGGADIETNDNSADTPIIEAAWGGRPNLTKLLIEKGAKVNAQSANGKTPLHWASENLPNRSPSITAEGRLAVVQILLENKANVNAKDSQGYTPLDLATKSEKSDIASLLKKHGGKHSDTFKKEKIAQQKAEKERIKQEQQKEQQKQKKLARLAKCEHVYVGQRKWLLETAFLIVPVTVLYEVVGVSSKAGKATVKYIDGPHRHSRYGMRKEVSCTEIPE